MPVDPDDLEKIEKAVNDGSGQVRGLWFAFLGFETYLAVAAGSVTHRMLLEEAALKLPLLNVELPLVGFFVIAPISFLIFHFYLLLQMLTLARKVALYNDLLKRQVADHDDRPAPPADPGSADPRRSPRPQGRPQQLVLRLHP